MLQNSDEHFYCCHYFARSVVYCSLLAVLQNIFLSRAKMQFLVFFQLSLLALQATTVDVNILNYGVYFKIHRGRTLHKQNYYGHTWSHSKRQLIYWVSITTVFVVTALRVKTKITFDCRISNWRMQNVENYFRELISLAFIKQISSV